MRVVFMGTPEFARPALERLIASSHLVVGVVTQPDRPKGRGGRVQPTPVKVLAQANRIPILQPEKVRNPDAVSEIAAWRPDILVVVAFGQILPQTVLDLPPKGCINVHASLLPKYRGAAPIAWAIIRGETETGVTTMRMDAGMDTGDMLLKERAEIFPNETAGELAERLSQVGAALLIKTLDLWERGAIQPEPQDHAKATMAPRVGKQDGEIRWTDDAESIVRRARGLTPDPGVFTYYNDVRWKIWKMDDVPGAADGNAGEILRLDPDGLTVAAGSGKVVIRQLQVPGGTVLSCSDFLRGHRIETGRRLRSAEAGSSGPSS